MSINLKKLEFIYSLRNAGVTETKLLSIMESIPRVNFIGDNFKQHAFEDIALPIGCGQNITQPSVVGIMTQSLSLTKKCKVLEIGTGSGYQTAILAKMARRVYSIEIEKKLADSAEKAIQKLNIRNTVIFVKDGSNGLLQQAPFDRIILTAAIEDIPRKLLDQLKPDGILVAPVDMTEKVQRLIKVCKDGIDYNYVDLRLARFSPLNDKVNRNVNYS